MAGCSAAAACAANDVVAVEARCRPDGFARGGGDLIDCAGAGGGCVGECLLLGCDGERPSTVS